MAVGWASWSSRLPSHSRLRLFCTCPKRGVQSRAVVGWLQSGVVVLYQRADSSFCVRCQGMVWAIVILYRWCMIWKNTLDSGCLSAVFDRALNSLGWCLMYLRVADDDDSRYTTFSDVWQGLYKKQKFPASHKIKGPPTAPGKPLGEDNYKNCN